MTRDTFMAAAPHKPLHAPLHPPLHDRRAVLRCLVTHAAQAAVLTGGVGAMHAALAETPAPRWPDVTLVDQDARERRLGSELVAGHASIVHFFYTGCGSVCPPQTALLSEVRRLLDGDARLRATAIVSISVDPLGDGPPQLEAYARRFGIATGDDARWWLLSGEAQALARVMRAAGVTPGAAADHTNLMWLGDGRGRWLRAPGLEAPAQLVRRLKAWVA